MPHQRSSRANLKGLEIMRFQLGGRHEILKASDLNEYLSSANLRFRSVSDDSPLQANLAHFASHTFAHVKMPGALVEWPRSPRSSSRVVVIVTEGDGFTVQAQEPVLERKPGLFLVGPGTETVRFHASAPTELFFVSCNVDSLSGISMHREPHSDLTPLEASQLRPLTSFVQSLCAITVGAGEDSALPLAMAGQEVTRALVTMAVGMRPENPDLFILAMQLILRDYSQSDISVQWAAGKLHSSIRTVQSAFTRQGTTFSRELRSIRLKAVSELRKRDHRLSLVDAAQAVGFGSSSAFYRAMKKAQSDHPDRSVV